MNTIELQNIYTPMLENHLHFFEGFLEAWDEASEYSNFGTEHMSGACAIYNAYCKIHQLPDLSCDEMIAEIRSILFG